MKLEYARARPRSLPKASQPAPAPRCCWLVADWACIGPTKRRLDFCEVSQDGWDRSACPLPAAEQAEEIMLVLGIRKRVELSPAELERRRAHSPRSGREIWASGSVKGHWCVKPGAFIKSAPL